MTTTGPVVERPYIVSLADRTRGGQRMALSYETEKVFGHARTGGNSNNCPSHRTGADSLASGQASLFETGKIFGRVQTGEGDNNRPRRTTATHLPTPTRAGWPTTSGPTVIRAKTCQVPVPPADEWASHNRKSLRPWADQVGRQQPASLYDSAAGERMSQWRWCRLSRRPGSASSLPTH